MIAFRLCLSIKYSYSVEKKSAAHVMNWDCDIARTAQAQLSDGIGICAHMLTVGMGQEDDVDVLCELSQNAEGFCVEICIPAAVEKDFGLVHLEQIAQMALVKGPRNYRGLDE
jgi:hypothetical protein